MYSSFIAQQSIEFSLNSLFTECCLLIEIRSRLDRCMSNCEAKLERITDGLSDVQLLDLMEETEDILTEELHCVACRTPERKKGEHLISAARNILSHYNRIVAIENDIINKLEELFEILLKKWMKRNKSIRKMFHSIRKEINFNEKLVALGAGTSSNKISQTSNKAEEKEYSSEKVGGTEEDETPSSNDLKSKNQAKLLDYLAVEQLLDLKMRKLLIHTDLDNILHKIFNLLRACSQMKQMFSKKKDDLDYIERKLKKWIKKHIRYCQLIESYRS